ncbi:MAG TPA: GNAT family N-acetyltransferase, partial [Acidimicrobiia bacterium]|nr:GNAT family N-acetyltransferase [Acidimicrobiia bacterium]
IEDSAMLGFAYGFSTLPPLAVPGWSGVMTAFQLTELAVAPGVRRRGLGRRLHDVLLESASPGPSWLVTDPDAVAAMALYRACGWQPLTQVRSAAPRGPRLVMVLPNRVR